MKTNKLTFKQVREMFWAEIATEEQRKDFRVRKSQSDYNCDIRCSFIDFADSLNKNGQITDRQRSNITL
jgi:hypothetical protein